MGGQRRHQDSWDSREIQVMEKERRGVGREVWWKRAVDRQYV
jgi:hypothetical protein